MSSTRRKIHAANDIDPKTPERASWAVKWSPTAADASMTASEE